MNNYVKLGKKILKQGHAEQSRIGPTIALHNQVLSYDLTKGFPLMTTKRVGPKQIINETIWYLQGTTSINFLEEKKVFVWSKFADEQNDIGKTYSYQFRNFCGVDQVNEVIKLLTENDENKYTSRRAIINLYNVSELNEMSIPPCIATIQFNVYWQKGTKYLSTTVNQRSADFCLGVPYDIAEMALLSHIIGVYTNATPKDLTVFYSNIHVYQAHVEELKLQLQNPVLELPTLVMNDELIKQTKPERLTEDMFDIINIQKGRPVHKYELF